MKKTLWMLGVAVAALTSCTQSEVLDVPESRVIGFEPFVGKSTRAANVAANMLIGAAGAANDLTSFWVYGSYTGAVNTNNTPFDGINVYWDVANSSFKYDSPQQWHIGSYQFAAYSNGNSELSNVNVDLGTRILTFTDYENDGNKDLLVAVPAAITKDASNIGNRESVKFNFKHMLACVQLRFTNASDAFALDFKDVKFEANSEGTCTFNATNVESPTVGWEDLAESLIYEFRTNEYNPDNNAHDPNALLLQPGTNANFYCFVIPQENSTIKLTFNVDSYNRIQTGTDGQGKPTYQYSFSSNDKYEASLNVTPNSTWEPGILYRYTADINGKNHWITFSVQSVEEWTSENKPAIETPVNPSTPQNP